MFNIAWTVLEMVYMGNTVRLQRHTKVFGGYVGKYLKRIFRCLYCNKCNKINMEHSDTETKFLFLFLAFCSEFFTLIILIFGFEGWQLWYLIQFLIRYKYPYQNFRKNVIAPSAEGAPDWKGVKGMLKVNYHQ